MSVCSGIEAASVAWAPLGWRCAMLSEIEAFPIAVLKHRQNAHDLRRGMKVGTVPLFGDFSALRIRHMRRFGIDLPDVLCGGTPCQGFSIAGLRGSMADSRSNLAFSFVRLAHAIQEARKRAGLPGLICIWENVPGVLSMPDNAFGCLLAGFVGADAPLCSPLERGRWPSAGMVSGPRARAAWRILNAQYFGVPQRRERVWLVVDFGNRADPAAVLFEPLGLRGNLEASGEEGKGIAGSLDASAGGSDENDAADGRLIAYGGNNTSGPINVATALNAHGGPCGRMDFESETFVTHALTAGGFDASEEGTGRGTPLVPVAYRTSPNCGAWETGDRVDAITTGTDPTSHIIAFSCKDHGADAGPVSPTLRAMEFDGSHANGGGQVAVAFDLRGREGGAQFEGPHDTANIRSASGGSSRSYVAASAVRRLMPVECERLQGFPDGYTNVPWRGRPAAPDGPMYKALGNSWAVPCARWIGERIRAQLLQEKPI